MRYRLKRSERFRRLCFDGLPFAHMRLQLREEDVKVVADAGEMRGQLRGCIAEQIGAREPA